MGNSESTPSSGQARIEASRSRSTMAALRAEQHRQQVMQTQAQRLHAARQQAEARIKRQNEKSGDDDDDDDDDVDRESESHEAGGSAAALVDESCFLERALGSAIVRTSSSRSLNNNNNNNNSSGNPFNSSSNIQKTISGDYFFDAVQPLDFVPPMDRLAYEDQHNNHHRLRRNSSKSPSLPDVGRLMSATLPSSSSSSAMMTMIPSEAIFSSSRKLNSINNRNRSNSTNRPAPPARDNYGIYSLRPSLEDGQQVAPAAAADSDGNKIQRRRQQFSQHNKINTNNGMTEAGTDDDENYSDDVADDLPSTAAAPIIVAAAATPPGRAAAAAAVADIAKGEEGDPAPNNSNHTRRRSSATARSSSSSSAAVAEIAPPFICDSADAIKRHGIDASFFATLQRCNERAFNLHSAVAASRNSSSNSGRHHQSSLLSLSSSSAFHVFEDGRGCVPLLHHAATATLFFSSYSSLSSVLTPGSDAATNACVIQDNMNPLLFLGAAAARISDAITAASCGGEQMAPASSFSYNYNTSSSASSHCQRCPQCKMCSQHTAMCLATCKPHCDSSSSVSCSITIPLFPSFPQQQQQLQQANRCRLFEAGPRWLCQMLQIGFFKSAFAAFSASSSSSSKINPSSSSSRSAASSSFVSLAALHSAVFRGLLAAPDLVRRASATMRRSKDGAGFSSEAAREESPSSYVHTALSLTAELLEGAGVTASVLAALVAVDWSCWNDGDSNEHCSSSPASSLSASSVLFRFCKTSRNKSSFVHFDAPLIVLPHQQQQQQQQPQTVAATAISLLFPFSSSSDPITSSSSSSSSRSTAASDNLCISSLVARCWCPELQRFLTGGGGAAVAEAFCIDALINRSTSRTAALAHRRSIAAAIVMSTLQKLLFDEEARAPLALQ